MRVGPACRAGPLSPRRRKVPSGRRDLLSPRSVRPLGVPLHQPSLFWIIAYVLGDFLVFLVRAGPMIEPLALPKPRAIHCKNLGGSMSRPAFEILQRLLQTHAADLAEQMQVRRHHDIFKKMPVAALLP